MSQSHPSNKVTLDNLSDIFKYHDDPQRIPHYQAVRTAARDLAEVILKNAPDCADRSAAIRSLRDVVMQANAAIALAPSYPFGL